MSGLLSARLLGGLLSILEAAPASGSIGRGVLGQLAEFAALLAELAGFLLGKRLLGRGDLLRGFGELFRRGGLRLSGFAFISAADRLFGFAGLLGGFGERVGGGGSGFGSELLCFRGGFGGGFLGGGVRCAGRQLRWPFSPSS